MTMEFTPRTRVLIIGASGGIGQALCELLSDCQLTSLSRSADGLDVTDEGSVAGAASAVAGPFDVILNTTGALVIDGAHPEKSLNQITPQAMAAQFALNAIGPALLLKHFGKCLPARGPAIFATLSARVGSIGDNHLGGWVSYRAAKAAQNQIVRTAAIELARRNRDSIAVALHPGTVATPLTRSYLGRHPWVTPAEAARNLVDVLGRLTPEHSGGFFDYAMREIPW